MTKIKNLNDLRVMSKDFLYKHAFIVDFLCASVIICLCLIVLLPKVHDSFALDQGNSTSIIDTNNYTNVDQILHINGNELNNEQIINQTATSITFNQHEQPNNTDQHNHDHHHHHHHAFPIGELIVSAGFIFFYIIGESIEKPRFIGQDGRLQISTSYSVHGFTNRSRRNSTICCPSTRCPSSQHQANNTTTANVMTSIKRNKVADTSSYLSQANESNLQESEETTALLADHQEGTEGCVLLFNRHHNHHTHNSHHEHNHKLSKSNSILPNSPASQCGQYGSTTSRQATNQTSSSAHKTSIATNEQTPHMNISKDNVHQHHNQRLSNPDEISIALLPRTDMDDYSPSNCFYTGWPRSIKVFILSLVFAVLLLSLEIQLDGLIQAVKVFRAAATGALLYIAFFLILPRDPPGCKSCNEEEIQGVSDR